MGAAANDVPEQKGPKRNQAEQISDSRNAAVRACCSLAEGVLMDQQCYESDWSTLEPAFLHSFQRGNTLAEGACADDEFSINWTDIPASLRPASGQLDSSRALNKERQVESVLRHAVSMVTEIYDKRGERVEVVEFGAGSGHLGLVLAYLCSEKCSVTLLERKEYACQQARRREQEAGLSNVVVANTSLHEFAATVSQFHLGISLHSCGVLTDAALALCLRHRAAFCFCPCCYGQTAANLPDDYLPRSEVFVNMRSMRTPVPVIDMQSLTSKERRRLRQSQKVKPFYTVARSADCTSAVDQKDSFTQTQNFVIAKRCMQIVDADRLLWVQQHGYRVRMASLRPLEVTPKNNLILGVPRANNVNTSEVDLTALHASSEENAGAEEGERRKTGQSQFAVEAEPEPAAHPNSAYESCSARVRTIFRSDAERLAEEERLSSVGVYPHRGVLPCAFHVVNAFDVADLEKLDALRRRIPLDKSRPTCPRRFLTEKKDAHGNQHQEDGWVGEMIDRTVASWALPYPFASLPWYRYLEYTEPGGHMDKHTDGSNLHPDTGARSVATMLLYFTTCTAGGETTLYRKDGSIVESVRPAANTVLIFPHPWQHSGDPVLEDPKICLRVDLAWKLE